MERRETSQSMIPHQLVLHQRTTLDLEGVTEVEHFDELSIAVCTTMGELCISGQNLHIRQLNLEDGRLSIEGQVDCLAYHDLKKRGGLFGRILR